MLTAGNFCRLRAPRAARGHEQRGARYCVVLQSDRLRLSTVIVAPTSTRAHPAPHRAEIEFAGLRTHVLVEQLRATDVGMLGDVIAHVGPEAMDRIRGAIDYVFDL